MDSNEYLKTLSLNTFAKESTKKWTDTALFPDLDTDISKKIMTVIQSMPEVLMPVGYMQEKRYARYVEKCKETIQQYIDAALSLERRAKGSITVDYYMYSLVYSYEADMYDAEFGEKLPMPKTLTSNPAFAAALSSAYYIQTYSPLWDMESTVKMAVSGHFGVYIDDDEKFRAMIFKDLKKGIKKQILNLNENSLKNEIGNAFAQALRLHLGKQMMTKKVSYNNYVREALIENDEDVALILRTAFNILVNSIEAHILHMLYPQIIESEMVTNVSLQIAEEQLTENIDVLRKEDKETIISYRAHVKQLENENKRLQSECNQLRKNDKMVQLKKEHDKLSKQYSDLEAKYKAAIDYIKALESDEDDEDDEEDQEEFTQDVLEYYEYLKSKKIVFYRSKEYEQTLIMKTLGDFFPKAKFVSCKTSDIDACSTDAVVMLTKYLAHKDYYKARTECKAKNIQSIHSSHSRLLTILQDIDEVFRKQ